MLERLRASIGDRLRRSRRVQTVRTWLQRHRAIALAATGVLVGAVVVLVVVLGRPTSDGPRANATPPPSASQPLPSAGASGAAASQVPVGTWAALDLPPYEPLADLVADAELGARIDATTTFTLRSHTPTGAVAMAAGLVIEPATDFTVTAGPSPDTATIRPTEPLMDNARYRIELRDPSGTLLSEWTFRTGGGLRLVRQLPADRSTQVPLDTGIELEFDQDGVLEIASHFSIDPEVEGTFERHGRTWVFVPAQPLAPATLYTVTVRAGLAAEGSAEGLEADLTLAFETAADAPDATGMHRVVFSHPPMFEIRPNEAGVIPVGVYGGSDASESFTANATIYRFPTASAAIDAVATLSVDRSWARWSSNGNVDTSGLAKQTTFEVTVRTPWNEQRMELPSGLPTGFYLLELDEDGRRPQLVLQVTDLAAYVVTSESRAVAWVNDLASGAAVPNATVVTSDGARLGQTDASGLLQVDLPAAVSSGPRIMRITGLDGSEVLAAVAPRDSWFWGPRAASSRWWLLLGTDRLLYRTDDTIRVWGFVKARADRTVPADAEIRLVAGWDPMAPAIARVAVEPTPRGTILADMPVRKLPPGEYQVVLVIGDEVVRQASITVSEIRKPSLRVELESERHAFVDGETFDVVARASFFDGTSAPGLQLRVDGSGANPGGEQSVKLGPDGTATLPFEAATTSMAIDTGYMSASPAAPEEGGSFGQLTFAVLPANVWVEADARIDDETLTVDGRLSRVDLAAAEEQITTDGWIDDPGGDPLGGRTVTAVVDRITWTAVQTGTTYDYVEKRAVPVYRYEENVEHIGSYRPVTTGDGTFALSMPFDADDAGARVTLRATDAEGRSMEVVVWASLSREVVGTGSDFPYLEQRVFCGGSALVTAELGEPFEVTMRSGDGSPDADGRTLFALSRGGLDEVVITTDAGIERRFEDDDLPSIAVLAVRLTGSGYIATNNVIVLVDREQKTLQLNVETDRDRYAPGDEVGLTVTTVGFDGHPVATDVIVQAVDAKLYAIGGASTPDPSSLMGATESGVTGAYATHRVLPPSSGEGCGATTGGGDPRDDFRDNATFQLIRTDATGRGRATFAVPDDLTSWVVSATAFSDQLDAGTTSVEVPVGLPFFVEASVAPEYLVGEQPILSVRAFGDALSSGDAVTFVVEGPSLGLSATTVDGSAFSSGRVPLPVLALGDHEITITAHGPGNLEDAIVRTIHVVPTRLASLERAADVVDASFVPPGGDGMTTYVITDAGRGAMIPVLQDLAGSGSARRDASLAADLARQILIEDFGLPESTLPLSGYGGLGDLGEDGLALLPYGSGDLFLTSRVGLVAPDRVNADYLLAVMEAELEREPTRERAIVALAGLAAAGRDVLGDLRAIDPEPLTTRERIWLGLGLAAAGDEEAARAIERSVLAEHGQRLGSWVRLDTGTETPETAETTASMLLLAATLRDPIAVDISRYLLDNPSDEHLPALEQIGFVRAALEWLPRVEARFTWTIDGEAHEEHLEPGESLRLTLTKAQRETLRLEPIEGSILVASSWSGPARYEDLPQDPSVTIERTVTPANHAPSDELVRVRLNVHFEESLEGTCYQVTDLLPSGLAPLIDRTWRPEDASVIPPYEVDGQRVSWCLGTDRPDVTLGYSARVVSAGTYRWEPAVIQAVASPGVGAATPVITYVID